MSTRWAPARTVPESLSRWKDRHGGRAPACAATGCGRPAHRFGKWCRRHGDRVAVWGSPTVRPRWTGTSVARYRKRAAIVELLEREAERGSVVVLGSLAQVSRWIAQARTDYEQHDAEGIRYFPPRRRSWARLWFRCGQLHAPVWLLAQLLLICEPEMEWDDRPDARACAVTLLLGQAASRRRIGRHPRGSLPPAPQDVRRRGERIIAPRASAAVGRRVLRALEPVMRLYALHVAERAIGKKHPRRPPHALEAPTPRRHRRWSHFERRYIDAS